MVWVLAASVCCKCKTFGVLVLVVVLVQAPLVQRTLFPGDYLLCVLSHLERLHYTVFHIEHMVAGRLVFGLKKGVAPLY